MAMFDQQLIKDRIATVAAEEMDLPPQVAADVAFHMTDWLGDLEQLVSFYREPEALSSSQASDLLLKFLIHAPNHIAAASKLYTGFAVSDVFEVGAVGDANDS